MANINRVGEIEEEEEEAAPLLSSNPPESDPIVHKQRSVTTKVPEAEVRLYKQGKGPIDVFKATLGGWDQDQLDIREILDRYGFKSVYAYNPERGRTVPIRFNPKNGRSLLTYNDGGVINLDGEPKDTLINPITKIIVGITVITFLIIIAVKESPSWARQLNLSLSNGSLSNGRIPTWVLVGVVILFTRMRKRTRNFFGKYFR